MAVAVAAETEGNLGNLSNFPKKKKEEDDRDGLLGAHSGRREVVLKENKLLCCRKMTLLC